MSDGIPVIIPLGTGSFSENLELRILLRSIERHLKGHGEIYLATTACPNWVNQDSLNVVPIPDRWQTCKDANLWEKTIETLRKHKIGQFIFAADDNVFMQDVDADKIPLIYNPRGLQHFRQPPFNRWRLRMLNTLNWARMHAGITLNDRNFDAHVPQLFNGHAILGRLEEAPYNREPGLCIYTAWRVLEHLYDPMPEALPQEQYKWTFQNECAELIQSLSDKDLQSRLFIGYNDGAISGGLLKRLLKIFPQQSIYEREGL